LYTLASIPANAIGTVANTITAPAWHGGLVDASHTRGGFGAVDNIRVSRTSHDEALLLPVYEVFCNPFGPIDNTIFSPAYKRLSDALPSRKSFDTGFVGALCYQDWAPGMPESEVDALTKMFSIDLKKVEDKFNGRITHAQPAGKHLVLINWLAKGVMLLSPANGTENGNVNEALACSTWRK